MSGVQGRARCISWCTVRTRRLSSMASSFVCSSVQTAISIPTFFCIMSKWQWLNNSNQKDKEYRHITSSI